MRFVISIGLMLSISMLVCGDYNSDHRGGGGFGSNTNYHQHGFPSVGSPDYRRPNDFNNNQGYTSVPLADNHRPSIYTHGFPSINDLRGNPNDYRGNSNDRRPNSDINTHGWSVNDLRGNPNTGYPNNNGYPNQGPYGRDPNSGRPYNPQEGGGFGGSSYNRPSESIGSRGSFGDPNMPNGYPQYNGQQNRPGYPTFNSINVGLSRFGLFNSNRPNYGNEPYGPNPNAPYGPGNSYPNRYPNANGTGSSVLDVAKFEGNKMRDKI